MSARYDHATELSIFQTPVDKLAYLVGELRTWASLNPGLKPLTTEFGAVLAELRDPNHVTPTREEYERKLRQKRTT